MAFRKTLTAFLIIVVCLGSLPSTFDIRYQPNIANYANFDPAPSTTCSAYDWTLTLAQTLSNAASVALKTKYSLSAQQIAECITS